MTDLSDPFWDVPTDKSGPVPESFEGRILYVEDNVRIAEITEMLLEDLGLAVTWTVSGEQALKLTDTMTEPFDLMITDVVMPGMSGIDLATALAKRWPVMPIVLTSGFSDDIVQGQGSQYELLQKPFNRMALIRCLDRYLGAVKRAPHVVIDRPNP